MPNWMSLQLSTVPHVLCSEYHSNCLWRYSSTSFEHDINHCSFVDMLSFAITCIWWDFGENDGSQV